MSEPLDESYLDWLYCQVGNVKSKQPTKTYWALLRQLYKIEFVWFIPNDDNRIEDGRDLRHEFLTETDIQCFDHDWLRLPCSILEMLVGISRRLSFEADGSTSRWFWTLIDNLGLSGCNDSVYNTKARMVEETIDRLVWRQYSRDGSGGGLFPLQRATRDQRKVEIWYQLSAYLLENE